MTEAKEPRTHKPEQPEAKRPHGHYVCRECGSDQVQHAFWVDLKTGEVLDAFGTWNYDDNSYCVCGEHGTLIEKGR